MLLRYHAKRQAVPEPTDSGRHMARALGLSLKGCIVPVLTTSFSAASAIAGISIKEPLHYGGVRNLSFFSVFFPTDTCLCRASFT